MTDATHRSDRAISRDVRLVRVVVLLVSAMVVLFSATLHEQLSFDRAIIAGTLAALAISHLLAWFRERTALAMALVLAALAGAVLSQIVTGSMSFAVVVAGWALATGILEFVGSTLQTSRRSDYVLMGATGVLLALLVLLVRDDPVAIIGFFGAYAVIGGVFLGISAFDGHDADAADAQR